MKDKIEEQLKMIENKESKQLCIKSVINVFGDELSQEVKNVLYTLSNQEKSINCKILSFKRDKNLVFDFRDYRYLTELFRDIYYKNFIIEEAERVQYEFNPVLDDLKK